MRLLILGGTVFLGRHVAEAALAAGHEVTLFTRGRSNPGLFPGAEHLTGDRGGDLSALESAAEWDLVVDTTGFVPRDVLRSARLLAGRAERYAFVSTAGVYREWPERPGIDESGAVHACAADAGPGDGDYGVLKAGCERAVTEVFAERAVLARAGLLVGPHENVGRLPAWLERAARGGPLVAPGPPERALQLLDARDLAAWLLEPGRSGAFVTVGPDLAMADLVAALPGRPEPVWASDADLLEAGVEPWTQLPFWLPEAGAAGALRLDGRAARLTTRPLDETVADTWAWMLADGREELRHARPARGGASVLDAAVERAIAERVRRRRN